MKSVVKAFKVLETFSAENPERTFTEIVRATGFGRTNTHKLLKTLASLNCLCQSGNGAPYRLGPKLFELGSQYLAQLNLRRVAISYLLKLSEEFEDTVYLCIEDNGDALCLERIDGPSDIKVTVLQRGGRLPLHVGAAPLVLLAGMQDEEIKKIMKGKPFIQFTPNTIRNMKQLMQKVNDVRQRGFALSWEDVTPGVASIGVPVRDATNAVVGAISIGGILLRFEKEKMPALIQLVKTTADNVSKELGKS